VTRTYAGAREEQTHFEKIKDGLCRLIQDVVGGKADFRLIPVYRGGEGEPGIVLDFGYASWITTARLHVFRI
jgi:hypothetical protein